MENEEKLNDKRKLGLSLSETEEIIGRLKDALDVKTDGQLAHHLGISRQNIGAARKRDDVPPGWLYKVAELTGCSMDWLGFGQGPKKRAAYSTEKPSSEGRLASQESAYKLQVSWKSRSADDAPPDEADISGFGAAVEMLAKIYSSEDKLLIRTINANIHAFCEAIDRKHRDQNSTKELADLKKRLSMLEKKLQ